MKGGRGEESLPEVVVEVVSAGFVGFVGEDYAGSAVVVLAGGVRDEALLCWAVGHLRLVTWGGITIRVGDKDIFVALRRGALSLKSASKHKTNSRRIADLCIITSNPRTTAPSTNPNVRLPVRKPSHEPLQLRIILDGAYSHNVAFLIHMHTIFQRFFGAGASPMPRCVQLLHEERVSLTRGRFPNLLNGHVAPGADNIAHIDEIISHEAILCNLCLLSFKAIVDRDDCTGSPIWSWKDGCCARLDIDGVIIIEAMDFEGLVVIGLVVDVDVMHDVGLRVPE